MGIFGNDRPAGDRSLAAANGNSGSARDESSAGALTALIEHLMDVGIDGRGPFDSATRVADVARAAHPDAERALDAMVRSHLRLAGVNGFLTSLGGFVTVVVALPVNVIGFYLIATRLVAGVAYVRGYDLGKDEVRSAVMLALVGADADDLLRKAGYGGTGRLVNLAAQRLPGPALIALNKGVAFRMLSQVGRKSLTRFGRLVPLAGGAFGAALDTYLLTRIADHARREFPQR